MAAFSRALPKTATAVNGNDTATAAPGVARIHLQEKREKRDQKGDGRRRRNTDDGITAGAGKQIRERGGGRQWPTGSRALATRARAAWQGAKPRPTAEHRRPTADAAATDGPAATATAKDSSNGSDEAARWRGEMRRRTASTGAGSAPERMKPDESLQSFPPQLSTT